MSYQYNEAKLTNQEKYQHVGCIKPCLCTTILKETLCFIHDYPVNSDQASDYVFPVTIGIAVNEDPRYFSELTGYIAKVSDLTVTIIDDIKTPSEGAVIKLKDIIFIFSASLIVHNDRFINYVEHVIPPLCDQVEKNCDIELLQDIYDAINDEQVKRVTFLLDGKRPFSCLPSNRYQVMRNVIVIDQAVVVPICNINAILVHLNNQESTDDCMTMYSKVNIEVMKEIIDNLKE